MTADATERSGTGLTGTFGSTAVRPPRPLRDFGPFDVEHLDETDPGITDPGRWADFGSIKVPVPPDGTVTVEPTANGRLQALHVDLPGGRLSMSALAAPKSTGLWPELVAEIDSSLREGGAQVRSFRGDWGRELHVRTGAADSVFIGVDGARWMLYGVATGPTAHALDLDGALRTMLKGTVVDRGRSPYPVRTVLPLVVPEHLAGAVVEGAGTVPGPPATPGDSPSSAVPPVAVPPVAVPPVAVPPVAPAQSPLVSPLVSPTVSIPVQADAARSPEPAIDPPTELLPILSDDPPLATMAGSTPTEWWAAVTVAPALASVDMPGGLPEVPRTDSDPTAWGPEMWGPEVWMVDTPLHDELLPTQRWPSVPALRPATAPAQPPAERWGSTQWAAADPHGVPRPGRPERHLAEDRLDSGTGPRADPPTVPLPSVRVEPRPHPSGGAGGTGSAPASAFLSGRPTRPGGRHRRPGA